MNSFVLKGDICHCDVHDRLELLENGYIVCVDGASKGVFTQLPEQYQSLELQDFTGKMIIPGLIDLHVHAPQYAFRGIGMDKELLDWLNAMVYEEEVKYSDPDYAAKAYRIFSEDLANSATTRASVYATVHVESTELLMDILEQTGLKTMVGKVNMDRNSPECLTEGNAERSAEDTRSWLRTVAKRNYQNTAPILTPRFVPSCSDGLLAELGVIQQEFGLPVQSHLSENLGEIRWVSKLCPKADFYGDAYQMFGLFGGNVPTIMAHCVHSSDAEIERIKERGVYIAHCPQSNANLASGIAPVRRYLNEGLHIGLGSDVAGGSVLSIFRAMTDAIQESKLRWRLVDESLKPITMEEAFWLGTKGGGSFFGKVGSFTAEYELDALVLDDGSLRHPQKLSLRDRLERFLYLSTEQNITHKFVAGRQLF